MTKFSKLAWRIGLALGLLSSATFYGWAVAEDTTGTINKSPIEKPLGVIENAVPPNVMFVLGREHTLFTAAYSDYTPLIENDKGDLYTLYHPEFNYEGMYATDLCYKYENNLWIPTASATKKSVSTVDKEYNVYVCSNSNDGKWLGNFLNYVTQSRMDVIKTSLYGGTRRMDGNNKQAYYQWNDESHSQSAILDHTKTTIDSHSWGKVFADRMYDNFTYIPRVNIEEISELSSKYGYFFGVYAKDFYATSNSAMLRVLTIPNTYTMNVPGDNGQNFDKLNLWDWISQESGANSNFRGPKDSPDTGKAPRFKKVQQYATDAKDFELSVVACSPKVKSSYNDICVEYNDAGKTYLQPEGILQLYGMGTQPRMLFGLITGGWDSNKKGAFLRDNISNKTEGSGKEYSPNTGELIYKNCDGKRCGFAGSLDNFRVKTSSSGHDYGDCSRSKNTLDGMNNNSQLCSDWGNPLAELLYQSVNYFQNKDVEHSSSNTKDAERTLGCVKNSQRTNPFNKDNYCAKSYSFLIADESPSFDSFSIAGSKINSSEQGKITNILKNRFSVSGKYLVGISANATSDENRYKAIPTIKTIQSLADVTGIAPTQAFSYGSYNVAGVAALAQGEGAKPLTNPNVAEGFNMQTFVLAMKPNTAEIKIPVNIKGTTQNIRLIPFAKTPAESSANISKPADDNANANNKYQYQSTNQIAAFYIQYNGIDANQNPYGKFIVSFEDFEYGSDYDMDWVVSYEYKIIQTTNNKYIQIKLQHEDGDIYAPQHAGYVITGVDFSGAYIDLAKSSSKDSSSAQGSLYALDSYIGDRNYAQCYAQSGDNFLNCLNEINTGDFGADIDAYYDKAILGRIIDTDGGWCEGTKQYEPNKEFTVPSVNNLPSSCVPLYYAPRYRISKYVNHFNPNKIDYFFKLSGKPASWRLIGDYYRNKNAHDNQDYSNDYSLRIFRISSEVANDVWLKSPLWYAAQVGMDKTDKSDYEDKITNDAQDPTNFSYISNPAVFRENIRSLISKLLSAYHSSSSFVPQSSSTTTGTAAYATSYNPGNWFGNIYKVKVDSNGGYDLNSINNCFEAGTCAQVTEKGWNAAYTFTTVAPEDRLIVTKDKDSNDLLRVTVDKDTAESDSASSGDLLKLVNIFGSDNKRTKLFIRWLLGDHSHEGSTATYEEEEQFQSGSSVVFRERYEGTNAESGKRFVLGDIINSDVHVVTFNKGTANEKILLAVGANDGMLHIIDDATGMPVISFIPTAVQSAIMETASVYYTSSHKFFVDSTPKSFERTVGGKKHTYLYGTLGLNFKGGYLLDITDLARVSTQGTVDYSNLYKWELTESDSKLVGKSREAPILYTVGTKDYLIYSSGYDAETPGVYVVDALAEDGVNKIISQIPLTPYVGYNEESENHRAISPIEIYAYQTSEGASPVALYAGDTEGYLYQIKLDGKAEAKPECWGGACFADESVRTLYVPKTVFYTGSNTHPITAKPAVANMTSGGHIVVFGTGSYWTPYDDSSDSRTHIQTLYAVKRGSVGAASSDTMLIKDKLMKLTRTNLETDKCEVKTSSSACKGTWEYTTTPVNQEKINRGWYLDLISFSNSQGGNGERIYRAPLVIGSNLYFTTAIPRANGGCETGGKSYLYQMNVETGKTELLQEIAGLANEMSATIHDGNIMVQVPYDNPDSAAAGVGVITIPDNNATPIRETSWIRLY